MSEYCSSTFHSTPYTAIVKRAEVLGEKASIILNRMPESESDNMVVSIPSYFSNRFLGVCSYSGRLAHFLVGVGRCSFYLHSQSLPMKEIKKGGTEVEPGRGVLSILNALGCITWPCQFSKSP